jgi:chromate reductase
MTLTGNRMHQYRIAVVVGSLRKESLNRKLAYALAKLAPPAFTFSMIEIDNLPLYNQDDDANQSASVKRMKNEVLMAHRLLFITAEYNRSIPGVLKNALDHGSRPYGKSVWNSKPAAVMGVSIGAIGTSLAQQHLRNVLSYLNMPTLCQPEIFLQAKDGFFDETGELGDSARVLLQNWMDQYIAWVKKHS